MNILYFFKNYDNMMYKWQYYHIVSEMKMHGCCIHIFSPLNYDSKEEANLRLLDEIRNKQYQLFMTCLTGYDLWPDTLKEIKKIGIPTLLFCPDNLVAPYNHRSIAPLFDLVWLTSKETEYLFNRWGAKTVFLPYAANPYFLFPTKRHGEEMLRVGFIGTLHGSRIDRVNKLLAGGVPVTVHSKSLSNTSKILSASPREYLKKIASQIKYPIGRKLVYAAIMDKLYHREIYDPNGLLEFQNVVPLTRLAETNGKYALMLSVTDADSTGILKKPVPIVNLRNFEIPMSGGLQFTTYTEEMASYFEDEKEIVFCQSRGEYIDKAKFYLRESNAQLRQKMRLAARKRAEAEDTWYCRFTVVFDKLGIH